MILVSAWAGKKGQHRSAIGVASLTQRQYCFIQLAFYTLNRCRLVGVIARAHIARHKSIDTRNQGSDGGVLCANRELAAASVPPREIR